MGFFPVENPQLLCLIILDSPDASRNLHWGSMSSAPVFKSVMDRVINIDKSMVQNDVSLNHQEVKLVEMSNGCICCTLREDLLEQVKDLSLSGKYDYLLIFHYVIIL